MYISKKNGIQHGEKKNSGVWDIKNKYSGISSGKIKNIFAIGTIGPLHDPVTWYGINYAGAQITQWNFQNKGTLTSPVSFISKVASQHNLFRTM